MHQDLLARMAQTAMLRGEIHRNDGIPANDAERQVESLMTLMQRGVQALILREVAM